MQSEVNQEENLNRIITVPGKITFRITAEHGVNFKILLPYLQTYVCIKILRG